MSWTKGQIVRAAFAELGLSSYDVDLAPEELDAALNELDLMMASWAVQGVQVGYLLASNPDDSDLKQDSGLPLSAIGAVKLGLAVRIAPSKGKSVSPHTLRSAKSSYDALLTSVVTNNLPTVQLVGGIPAGAGRKHRPKFLNAPIDSPVQQASSTNEGVL